MNRTFNLRSGRGARWFRTVLLIAGLGLAGCAGSVSQLPGDETASAEALAARYHEEEFGETILGAREFLNRYPGSRYVDQVRFLLARSLYEEGEYLECEDQLRRFLRDFPESPYAEEGAYYLGLTLLSQARGAELDQEETIAAQVQFRSFISRYPDSGFRERAEMHIANIRNRLAEKQFKNGRTYFKARAHRAAKFYFEEKVIRDFPESDWVAPAMLKLAEIAEREKDWSEVARWCGSLLADHDGTEEAGKARELLEKATRELDREAETGSAEADETESR